VRGCSVADACASYWRLRDMSGGLADDEKIKAAVLAHPDSQDMQVNHYLAH
jgi:hypothetical protein